MIILNLIYKLLEIIINYLIKIICFQTILHQNVIPRHLGKDTFCTRINFSLETINIIRYLLLKQSSVFNSQLGNFLMKKRLNISWVYTSLALHIRLLNIVELGYTPKN